ncbi:MAG: hypothetical protein OXT68_11365 [Chloroflexota bacterium]|nr:hypothetical protein [Chloroflexota bacterium]
MSDKNDDKQYKPKRPVGRPQKPLPSKPDGIPYAPEEVARILMTTSPQQLEDWRQKQS